MHKKITIILWCSIVVVIAAQCTTRKQLAVEKPRPFVNYEVSYDAEKDELTIKDNKNQTTLIKKYTRDDYGCVKLVEFYNDPANCLKNEQCMSYLEREWYKCQQKVDCKKKLEELNLQWPPKMSEPVLRKAIDKIREPEIWGEILVSAGSTRGDSDVCGDFRFTVAGSPGWDCDSTAGGDRIVCSCIGFYVGPEDWPDYFDHCCDPKGCVQAPRN